MSGHSKWSKVKHQKASSDVAKSQAFTKASRAITVAIAEGGGIADPEANFRLRLAIEKAREINMSKETINRAIASSVGDGVAIEPAIYEGYGPGGVAFLVEVATDNRQRAVAAVKHLFDRAGGSLTSPGAVSFLFDKSGVITVPKTVVADKLWEVATEAGAQDIVERADVWEVYTEARDITEVKQRLAAAGIPIDNTILVMKPKTTVTPPAASRDLAETLATQLEELSDVQNVYTNLA